MKYFEDYELNVIGTVGSHFVSKQEIIEFAKTWDPQPFHIDETAALNSVFQGLAGASSHAYALCAKLSLQRPEKSAILAALGIEEMKFPNPLRPNATVRLQSQCIEKRISKSRHDCGIVKSQTHLLNQDDEIILSMISNVLVSRRPNQTL